MQEIRCPICHLLLAKADGTVELCCRGGKQKHDKTILTFSNGKLIKQERPLSGLSK